jgi:hypothetical protein
VSWIIQSVKLACFFVERMLKAESLRSGALDLRIGSEQFVHGAGGLVLQISVEECMYNVCGDGKSAAHFDTARQGRMTRTRYWLFIRMTSPKLK